MIKIITLANLQLFLTKCKSLFALKKHTHTASDITGLNSGADGTRYTVDENGYTVIKDKNGNDACMLGEICYGMNLPLKNSSTDTNPTTEPIKGIWLHKTYVELTGPDNSIYGQYVYLGDGIGTNIDVNTRCFNFDEHTDIAITYTSIPSLFPNRAIPNINSLLSQVTNAIISVPDEELTYGYMYDYSEEICVFHNESHTMYFLKNGDLIQPLSIPVFDSVDDALALLSTNTQLLYARNPNDYKFELMYYTGARGYSFENIHLDESPQEYVGYDKIVNLTNAFLKLKELSEKI